MRDRAAYYPYLAVLSAWFAATAPAWWGMAQDWWVDSNYSHGLLVVPVALYFLWRERNVWGKQEIRPSVWGFVLFGIAAVLYVVGTAAAENFSIRTAAVLGVGTLAWALLGWRFVRAAWFPFVFLFFAVPWPYIIYYRLTFPLQLFSTKAACSVLDLLGMTFSRQGNVIHLPGYSLEVVEACSGVRSLLSLTTLGAAYAYVTQEGPVRPWLLFFLSGPIALGANIVRLIVTALGVYGWGEIVAQPLMHEVGGILAFVVALLSLTLTGSMLLWAHRKWPSALP